MFWLRHRQVCGQFNRGFIITRLRGDLYIVDQHASDEKRRFEELQRTTAIQTQPFIRPLRLEFAASEEETIINHLDVFEKNGAKFAALCLPGRSHLAPHRSHAWQRLRPNRNGAAKSVGKAGDNRAVCLCALFATGFSIHYDADAPLTQRLQLRSVRPIQPLGIATHNV